MLSQAKFYGGAKSYTAANIYLPLHGQRVVRVASSGFGFGAQQVFLPKPERASAGGFYYLILNRADLGEDDVEINLADGTAVATVAPQTSAYVFLLDRDANNGNGQWLFKGAGSVSTGSQGDNSRGLNYGTAATPTGFTLDLGTAAVPNDGFNEVSLDMGTASTVPSNPSEF